jgi:hypothetical protein
MAELLSHLMALPKPSIDVEKQMGAINDQRLVAFELPR